MELLQHCQSHSEKYYGELLHAAEKTLEDTLFKQAESCTSNEDQRRYFEAMQELKNNSGAMHAVFGKRLNKRFDDFIHGRDEEASLDSHLNIGDLSLVKREELEDELAISVIVSKGNSRNSESLWKLNRRLAVIRGGKSVSDETNPFGPAAVCDAIHAAVSLLNVDDKSRILIYKQLGKVFVVSFSKELCALNDLLVEKGILPNLKFSLSNREQTTTSQPSEGDEASANSTTESLIESATSIAHQQELYQSIRTLQTSLQSRTEPRTETAGGVSLKGLDTSGTGGIDTFSAIDYALTLSAIQQSQALLAAAKSNQPLSADLVESKFVDQLQKQAKDDGHHKMSQDDADTVDLVGMIFRYMLDDSKLHDVVKSMLSHLHTPYLKLALMDKSFLDNYQHNARILLNTMADVGGRWVKDEDDRTVLPKIKTTVENVLKGFVDDVTIFDRLLEDFSRFKDNLEKRAQMVEKRNTEAQQGLEKLEISKQKAMDEVVLRLEKADVPPLAQDLLRQPWCDFLAFNLLRHGEDSLTWASALKVLDGVVWSVRPDQAVDSKEDLHRRQIELDQTVAEGLTTIGYDKEASKNLLESLREAQELIFHGAVMDEVKESQAQSDHKVSAATAAPKETDKKPTESAITRQMAKQKTREAARDDGPPLSDEERSMIDTLKEIAFGTWFEFDRETNTALLKLAWFSKVTAHYMFVDQSGVKQAVETQNNLARGMCAGNIRIVQPSKKSFMERALEAVFNKLKLS